MTAWVYVSRGYSEGSYTHGLYDSNSVQTLVLLLDVKRAGQDAFVVAHKQLQPRRDKGYLSCWDSQEFHSRVAANVRTGETLWTSVVSNDSYRDIFFDAPLSAIWGEPRSPTDSDDPIHIKDGDINSGEAIFLSEVTERSTKPALASERWTLRTCITSAHRTMLARTSFVRWLRVEGALAQTDAHYSGQICGAKRRDLKARYWGTPLWPTALHNHIWHDPVKEGAAVLNFDDLAAAARQHWSSAVHDSVPRL
ncbi:Altered inheritance of mitochondria protein 6 [Elasticomyces elasticus]|nr:Altered inheritance of mitochondria protein 6 [Elasticomyces elasticus]